MKLIQGLKIIWQYLSDYKKTVYLLGTLALIVAGIDAAIPYLYGKLVDLVLKEFLNLNFILSLLFLWLVLSLISSYFSHKIISFRADVLGAKCYRDLFSTVFSHLLILPLSFHKNKKIGEILSRIERSCGDLWQIVTDTTFSTLPSFLTVIVVILVIFKIRWQIAIIFLVVLTVQSLITIAKIKPIIKNQVKEHRAWDKALGRVYDGLLNIQTVKSSTNESFEEEKTEESFAKALEWNKLMARLWSDLEFWRMVIFGFGFTAIFTTCLYFLRMGLLSAGQLVMFLGYVHLGFQPFWMLHWNYRLLQRGLVSINRTCKLLKIEPEKYQGLVPEGEFIGRIEFQEVSFEYEPNQSVLEKISFLANPGEAIALVGESGVGKTTLVDLISGYFKPIKGKILIDGIDISEIDLKFLRKNIALVPQEVLLFNDTIKNNIGYGKIEASDEEIFQAAKAANADEFINKFPKKYEQLVGERGIKLSTGQKQRVAIARAILRNPKILILDEATSSLDSVSEKLVQEALDKLITKERTTFIIAHRLSTVKKASKIIVLENGRISQTGVHQDLIQKDGLYAQFWKLQTLP